MRLVACFAMPLLLARDFEQNILMSNEFDACHMMPDAACHMPVKTKTSNGKAGSQKKRAEIRHAASQREKDKKHKLHRPRAHLGQKLAWAMPEKLLS